MSSASDRVVRLHPPISEDALVSIVEQAVLCHPAVQDVECSATPDGGIRAEVVVWRGGAPRRTLRDIGAALGAVLDEVPVRLSVVAVAYRRRSTVLLALTDEVYK